MITVTPHGIYTVTDHKQASLLQSDLINAETVALFIVNCTHAWYSHTYYA